jgi:ATP-dependent DNA helicase RecG
LTLYLDSPVTKIKGVGTKYAEIFNKNRISTVFDLLLHFPALYIDFSRPAARVQPGIKALYRAEILNSRLSRLYRKRLSVLNVNARVGSDPVQLVFFNKHYLEELFKTSPAPEGKENREIFIYGTFEIRGNSLQANTPLVFTDPGAEPVSPLYDKIGPIKSGTLKKIISHCFMELRDSFEFLPPAIIEQYRFPGIVEGLKTVHFPASYNPEHIRQLKQRFIYGEFLFFQLELQYIRNFFKRVPRINHYEISEDLRASLEGVLPFSLTPDQWTACEAIAGDLKQAVTMQRLLQGDVGSGKTIVAFILLLLAARNGLQGAFLAPTEILAQQHFLKAREFFKSASIEILTGSTAARERKNTRERLEEGAIDIIFGTHALLNEQIRFKHLSVVVIDEQHRFGVSQRAALYYKGKAVDLLVTTATPIPRTMLLSLYNDLSVSVIKTKPEGRLPVITKVYDPMRRDEFYRWLRKEIEKGEKAYIILPLIEDSEFFTELRSIESETRYFKTMFQGIPLGVVSGRTPAEEKDAALQDFTTGKTRILISTTVIEVGIDVKDATVIVIENADRYGLSQLHQLRGRVGRGERQSYCYLFASPNMTDSGKRRLKTIASTSDGFKIAEIDLKMRGGGIITGPEQSGYLDFKVGNMQDDHEIFDLARRDAARILDDPSLQNNYTATFLSRIKANLKDINFS